MTNEPKFWVEARTAICTSKLMSYQVWTIKDVGGRTCVGKFSVHRKGGWEVALYLANTLRDDLNAGIE